MNQHLFSLKDKVVVITGAAGLLGESYAWAIASVGGIPILIDIDQEKAQGIAEKITRKFDVDAFAYRVDVTDESSIKKSLIQILSRYSGIDGLINNAANNPKMEDGNSESFSRLENFGLDAWNKDISVGLTGAFLCAKHYGAAISRNKGGGSIVNISSDLGLIAPDQRLYRVDGVEEWAQPVKPVSYSVVKTGILGLTRYLATYWPGLVRCNALCPGGVDAGQEDDFIKKLESRIPAGRMASSNEYQGAIVFLLSSASDYMNGAIIPMDGGRSVW